jgi:predicted hotdog family 3-hydroxylacyl-ACP dehydratase
MVLLDAVLAWTETSVTAGLTVHAGTAFFESGRGVAAHIGLEWMAQTCGLFAGLEAKATGQPVRLGFLLGTRRYQAVLPWFTEGSRPVISAGLVFREDGMAVFDCRIDVDGMCAAEARLTLYQPEGGAADLSGQAVG